jgi:trehalose-6-phosphate synthase
VKLVTLDLSREDHDAYYLGYSNGVLWPVFHYRLDLADFDAGYIAGYRRVNQLFARKLKPMLREDDIIWVQDYHLIPWPPNCGRWAARTASASSCTSPAPAADPGSHTWARLADPGAVCL